MLYDCMYQQLAKKQKNWHMTHVLENQGSRALVPHYLANAHSIEFSTKLDLETLK